MSNAACKLKLCECLVKAKAYAMASHYESASDYQSRTSCYALAEGIDALSNFEMSDELMIKVIAALDEAYKHLCSGDVNAALGALTSDAVWF